MQVQMLTMMMQVLQDPWTSSVDTSSAVVAVGTCEAIASVYKIENSSEEAGDGATRIVEESGAAIVPRGHSCGGRSELR